MNERMRLGTAVAIAFIAAGILLLFDVIRPGMGIASLVLAVALFAAGGVNAEYRLLWLPFAVVGVSLAALTFTALRVPTEPVGLLCFAVGLGALLFAAGSGWLRSVARRGRPWRRMQGRR